MCCGFVICSVSRVAQALARVHQELQCEAAALERSRVSLLQTERLPHVALGSPQIWLTQETREIAMEQRQPSWDPIENLENQGEYVFFKRGLGTHFESFPKAS